MSTILRQFYPLGLWIFVILGASVLAGLERARADTTMVWLGDSLGSGYLLKSGESALPKRLEAALRAKGCRLVVTNESLPGAQSLWGLSRIESILQARPTVLVLALGANDALTGRDPLQTKRDLAQIIERAAHADIDVLLLAVKAPRNWGADYIEQFDSLFPELARQHSIPLFPNFMLEFVWQKPLLMQSDGLHPNSAGVTEIVSRLLPFFQKHLDCL